MSKDPIRDAMKNPEGKTCGECAHWKRCSAIFIGEDAGGNTSCDFSPSRWREKRKEKQNAQM